VEDIKADPLLGFHIPLNGNVAHFPNLCPCLELVLQKFMKTQIRGFPEDLFCSIHQKLRLMITRYRITAKFMQAYRFSFARLYFIAVLHPKCILIYYRIYVYFPAFME